MKIELTCFLQGRTSDSGCSSGLQCSPWARQALGSNYSRRKETDELMRSRWTYSGMPRSQDFPLGPFEELECAQLHLTACRNAGSSDERARGKTRSHALVLLRRECGKGTCLKYSLHSLGGGFLGGRLKRLGPVSRSVGADYWKFTVDFPRPRPAVRTVWPKLL